MTQKRPKITVTEQNREFVIPTLVKFGGVNIYNKKSVDLIDGSIYCISELGNAIVEENCNGLIRASLAEVDPNDYVGVKSEPALSTVSLGDLRSDKMIIAQLRTNNEKLRECLSEFVTLHDEAELKPFFYKVYNKAQTLLNK